MRTFCRLVVLGIAAVLLAGCGGRKSSGNNNDSYVYTTPTPAPAAAVLDQAAPLCDAAFRSKAGGAQTAAAVHGPVLTLIELDESQVTASARDSDLGRWFADNVPDISGVPPAQIATSAGTARALLCLLERQVQVGSFEISGSPAIRIDYDVRLLSWPDGVLVAGASFTGGDPPSSRTVSAACRANSDGYGCHDPLYGPSPAVDLESWLTQQLGSGQ
jgi:hypothetical protein